MKYKSVLLIAVFVCIAQLFYGQERYTIRGEFPDHSLDNEYVLLYLFKVNMNVQSKHSLTVY